MKTSDPQHKWQSLPEKLMNRAKVHRNEPQGKLKMCSDFQDSEPQARNEMEGDGTETDISCQTPLTKPQGNIKNDKNKSVSRNVMEATLRNETSSVKPC